jgi:DNA polymerase-1
MIYVDTETFFPWPPESEITAPERRRRKLGLAHPLAVDSRRNGLRLLIVSDGSNIQVFDYLTQTIPDDIREQLATEMLVVHNADFDISVLRRHGFEVSSEIFDTMLASQLLSLGRTNPKRDRSPTDDDDDDDRPADNDLGSVIRRYLGIALEKSEGGSDWSINPLTPVQLAYAKNDVAYFPDLVCSLTKALKSAKLWDTFKERSEFFMWLNDIKFNGVPVNRERLHHDQQMCEGLKLEKREELKTMFADYRPPIPKSRRKKSKLLKTDSGGVVLAAEEETEEFNPNVPGQVVAALLAHGINVENTTKETLAGIDSPETRLLLAYKEQMALYTMISGIARSVFPDNRVRPMGWNQLAAKTGRIMSSRPNLQNLPRDWRHCFEAPDPYQWLKIDLSQIEMRVIAIHCQDERLINLLALGQDIYVEVAAEVFGRKPIRGTDDDQVTDTLRSAAKTLTLGIAYGMGPRTFIRRVEIATRPRGSVGVPGLVFEMEEARQFFTRFFDMFPGIARYHDEARQKALTDEYTFTVAGQRRALPTLLEDQDPFGYWPSFQFRKRCIINSPIQGSAADLFVRAVNRFAPSLTSPVVNLVHDEIDALVTEDTARHTVQTIADAFRVSFLELFGDQLKVELEYSIGPSWGEQGKAIKIWGVSNKGLTRR